MGKGWCRCEMVVCRDAMVTIAPGPVLWLIYEDLPKPSIDGVPSISHKCPRPHHHKELRISWSMSRLRWVIRVLHRRDRGEQGVAARCICGGSFMVMPTIWDASLSLRRRRGLPGWCDEMAASAGEWKLARHFTFSRQIAGVRGRSKLTTGSQNLASQLSKATTEGISGHEWAS